MRKLVHAVLAAAKHLSVGVLATATLLAAYAIAGPDADPSASDEQEPAILLTPPIQEQLDALCAATWPDDEMHAEARRRACAKD
ncbi:hypothetical protein J2X56_001621 [Herbaspirillum sp. 1173]|uniref:hypothetical protein n=1 Tax=Herbaspirillum sp. 1173 TaxID=2817734 RepID=UPI002856E7A6|nr:hypothetical protein [Herbaspirillum sp. 1173]MDR6739607.1 hypothetical protein [Herbaspirillum sp. 1173]